MKLYPAHLKAICEILCSVVIRGMAADVGIVKILAADKRRGARDRASIAETSYEIIRYLPLYAYAGGTGSFEDERSFLPVIAAFMADKNGELPGWSEFAGLDGGEIRQKLESARNERRLREGIPLWLDVLGENELTKELWEKEIAAQNKKALLFIRANTLKTNVAKLQVLLKDDGFETEAAVGLPDALVVKTRGKITSTQAFESGLFEIQDASSQLVGPMLKPEQNETVIDACAGAGGKSLHISSLMCGGGKIMALDVEQKRLTELKKRAKRAGANNIRAKLIDENTVEQLKESADALLLDVPCSGLGTLKRKPELKLHLSPEVVESVKQVQREILQNYSTMLKKGGRMLYSTCSILPGENAGQVSLFLKNNKNFSLLEEKAIFAYDNPGDGFYMALLKKE